MKRFALISLLLVLLVGCGSGDSAPSSVTNDNKVKDAIDDLVSDPEFPGDREQAECFITYMLENTSIEIDDLGQDDLEPESIEDFQELFQGYVEASVLCNIELDLFSEESSTDSSDDFRLKFGDDLYLDRLYTQCADGDDQACDDLYWVSPYDSEYLDFASTCGGRDCEIPILSGAMSYGEDPYLDDLYDYCADGDDWACQLLWEESPIDSEYESFALTCGGRDCDITTLGIPMSYGDDPYLDDLYDYCADGDDWACQLLWEESPIDSEYESFALTCGGRDCEIETPNTVPWGGGSLDLDALYADCSDGNDDACVLLSDLSPDSEIREFAKTCAGRGGDCSSFG